MKNRNEPAIPTGEIVLGGDSPPPPSGMTKREFAAATIMVGVAANPEYAALNYVRLAELAVEMADALFDDLEKTETFE